MTEIIYLKWKMSIAYFRCDNIGTTDARLLVDGLQTNNTLIELYFSNNYLSTALPFCKGIAEYLSQVRLFIF